MTSHSKLPIEWYVGCTTKEEKEARETLVRNSNQFASLFLHILQRRADIVERKGLKEEDYHDTSWITLQAFRNGRLAEMTDLADLFSFIKGVK
jgi:hypothetical protein